MIVVYLKEDKRQYEAERAQINRQMAQEYYDPPSPPPPPPKPKLDLSGEVNALYDYLLPPQKITDDVKNIKNRIQVMVNQVWPGCGYQVVLFGSSVNSLSTRDSDVDLCITVPQEDYERDLYRFRNRLSKQSKSIYNMFYLAARLRDMGMHKVEAVAHAQVPICKFVDPQTGYSCDINTNNVLGIENSEMIKEYCSLDTRIRPLIFAVKYFVKQKNINHPRGGTLSSYAYVLMILHFLMNAPGTPVIPSLQETPRNCKWNNCNFHFDRTVALLQNNQIMKWNPCYHDCLYIDNMITKKFEPEYRNTGSRWEGYNKDAVGELLRSFFRFYSDENNFCFSIISAGGEIQQYQNMQSTNCPFIIQDPFIRTKNVARSCTEAGARVVLLEFERAAKMLSDGIHTFEDVCTLPSNISRPLDQHSLDFQIQQKKTVKTQKNRNSNGRQVETLRQEETSISVSTNDLVHLGMSPSDSDDDHWSPDDDHWWPPKFLSVSQPKATPSTNNVVQNAIPVVHQSSPLVVIENKPKTDDLPAYIGLTRFVNDDEQREIDSLKKREPAPSSSGSSSSATKRNPADMEPILNLVKTLMELKPSVGENTPVDTYASKPCTDMSKLLESSVAKDVSAQDICYLIGQLNFLGDTLAEKLTKSTRPTSSNPPTATTSQQRQSSSSNDESEDIRELQNMFTGMSMSQNAQEVVEEEEEEDSILIFPPTRKYGVEEIVTIQYFVKNPPDDYIEEYEFYSLLRWYGEVMEVLKDDSVTSVWIVTMEIRYGNIKLLPAEIDIGHVKSRAYAMITSK